VTKDQKRIAELERRVRELEAKPTHIPPLPYPPVRIEPREYWTGCAACARGGICMCVRPGRSWTCGVGVDVYPGRG